MITLGQQKLDPLTIFTVAVLVAVACVVSLISPILLPWTFLGLAGTALVVFWALKWEMTILPWFWVLSYGLLEWPTWKFEVFGSFNMTVPRYIFVLCLLVFALHFTLRRWHIRWDRPVLWVMLALLVYCVASMSFTGWTADAKSVVSAPYYRFLVGMLFPFTMFFLVYNVTHSQRQIPWGLILLSLYGWYALYIGYTQFISLKGYADLRQYIWPAYINDADYGIHFERARGAFVSASPQAIFLVLLFYVDLFLIRRLRGLYRPFVIAQVFLIPPALFFTGMRSAFVAFLICGTIWCLIAARRRFPVLKWGFAAAIVVVLVGIFWDQLAQTDRLTGGVAQESPIEARAILAEQTWDIFKTRPIAGVGFGHFTDIQMRTPRDPGSQVGLYTEVVVEHNLFLSMLAETGIIGLAAIVAIFYMLFRQSVQLYRKLPATAEGWLCRPFVVLFWVAFANLLTDAMFRDTLWDAFANGLFWILAGLVVGYNRLLEPAMSDVPDVQTLLGD